MYKIFPLSLILRLDAIFTLAGHVQLKIMPIPLFKTKSYQILVSKPFRDIFSVLGLHVFKHRSSLGSTGKEYKIYVKNFVMLRKEPTRCQESKPQTSTP